MAKEHCVYFIKSGKFIKIGRTKDLGKRIDSLRTGAAYGLDVLFTVPCDGHRNAVLVENVLHNMFSQYREHGEWFRNGKRLRSFITKCQHGDKRGLVKLMCQINLMSPRQFQLTR